MKTLWVVGCSIAHGVGIAPSQRWGELLSKQLNLPVKFLTAEGSSIEWAADQILQSNISANDIVCWGLTTPNRYMYYDENGHLQHILTMYYHNHPEFQSTIDVKRLIDNNLAYKAVNYIKQVQNFLNKLSCEHSIGYMLPGILEHKKIIIDQFSHSKNFFTVFDPTNTESLSKTDFKDFFSRTRPTNNYFVDVGSDGIHPGQQQHQVYAEQFLKNLNNQQIIGVIAPSMSSTAPVI